MSQLLIEKWKPLLESDKVEKIVDPYRNRVTATLLENQERFLSEASAQSVASNIANWDPVLINLVRRLAPKLIAYDICGVQPMTGPTGLIFAMRAKYTNAAGPEAQFNEANSAFSGTGSHLGANPFDVAGSITGISVTNQGSGYTSAPTVTITGDGFNASATAILGSGADSDKVVSVIVNNGGYSFSSVNVTFTGGAGTGAAATAAISANPYSTGRGKDLADGEVDMFEAMTTTIEKTSVTAKTRQLRADYSLELAQDLRAIHGLDAETELSNILSSEIIAEINREIVRLVYNIAKPGAQFATKPGTYDLVNDADGRWFIERFKGLMFAIERDANAISIESRRGKGNLIITSSDVASALAMAGVLNYSPALQAQVNLDVDVTGTTYAGTMGRFKVYVDPYLSSDGYVVGYKGPNPYDAGVFYAPYVPLQMVRATNVDTFQPAIGFKTRYGLVSNPFTSISPSSNVYYRKCKVENLL